MVSWFAYAAATAALLVVMAAGAGALFESADPTSLWLAALVAWAVQLMAFAAGRTRGLDFMVSWAGGMLLRFAVVAGAALWVTRSSGLDAATALVGLVGFVMVLVLLEPLFLRLAD
jgi:hypothetical protein